MRCEFCKSLKEVTQIVTYQGMHAKYCLMCGSPLRKMQPLTYDEIREMDGEPVYARGNWHLVWVDDEGKVWLQRPMTLGEPNGIRNCRDALVECIWAYEVDVYRHPPEEEA